MMMVLLRRVKHRHRLAPAWWCRARVPAMPLPPSLSPEQRQAALEKAAAARRQRAELKEKLKMGSLTLKELLDQAARDEVVGKMKVLAVLESLPGLGKVKARRLMDEIGISEARRVQGLGANQRRKLFDKLGQPGGWPPPPHQPPPHPPPPAHRDRRHLRSRRCRQGHPRPSSPRARSAAVAVSVLDHPAPATR